MALVELEKKCLGFDMDMVVSFSCTIISFSLKHANTLITLRISTRSTVSDSLKQQYEEE
jgi:hypothetical protein